MSPGEAWEKVSCPICPADTVACDYLKCPDRFRSPAFDNYSLDVCSGCGLIYLSPRPAPDLLGAHHSQAGYDPFLSLSAKPSLRERLFLASRSLMLRWKRRLIRKILPNGGRLLDIGCGAGEFLDAVRNVAQVEGVEPDLAAARFGAEHFGLKIHNGLLEQAPLAEESFDVVTMWHALEHVPKPLETLQRIKRILKPSGWLLIAVPNIASFDAKFYGSHWVALDAPRHLWHFSPDTLDRISKLAGFAPVWRKGLPLDPFYNILMSENLLTDAGRGSPFGMLLRAPTALAGSLSKGWFASSPSSMLAAYRK